MAVVIRFKRGQSTSWESKNLLLGPGEPGFELDTKQLKIGDGTTVWNELPYINDNERLQTIEEALQDVYTKSDIDSKLTALFRYKGSKESYSDLPEADENQTGDVWNIENADETHSIKAGDNVAWNGSQWDVLSGVFDLSDYVKKDGNKQLSTEDYTTEEKQKLGGIEDGAQVNEVTSQEFSELEERVGSLETDAETLAKADGSNATGKWIAGANEADQLATPRTINGAEFDGTKDISTNWTWDRCINPHYNDTPKTYKILTYDGQTDGHTSTYICCASSYGSESFTFILNFNYQKDLCNITGTLPANMQIKSNKNGVYISIQKYVEFYMTCIRGGKNSNLFSQYAFTEEEIPEDAVEPQITEMQVALKGEAGQIVGFDEDGQVISIDADSLINGPKYGVSGVGGSSPTLTRLWDSVGLTAAVGTDTQEVTNDFDNLPPFNRRKCVGTWSEPDATGKAHFTVKAYYGDPDYTEDGTMGDYVAVEVEPFYYIQDMENGIWGVSPKYQPGWKIHPVCIDKKTQTVRAKTYLPCYRMAIEKNADTGKGVSLPDLYPVGNSYYQLKTWAHNYNTAGYLEPAEVRNYEELLFTIEFATTNSQSIMAGATSLYVGEDYKCAAEGTSVNYVILTAAQGDNLVVGQNIQITDGSIWSAGLAKDVNKITTIEKCTVDGTVSDSGTYRKVTFDGTARTVTTSTKVTSRPYNTGSCKNVKTPSGSPTNNINGKYPMRYRWREDIWGDIYSTSNDLFDHLDTKKSIINYYYLTDPLWMPGSTAQPSFTEFQKDPFVQLEQHCTNASNFIVKMQGDSVYPYCLVPTNITGGTNATYYCDLAWFLNSTLADRSLRFGCNVSNGLNAGLFSVGADYAPSVASWYCGGGLFLEQ